MTGNRHIPGGLTYLAVALTLTWACWLPAAAVTHPEVSQALHYLGGVMPLAAALFFLWRWHPAAARRAYWRGICGSGRIRGRWWLVVLFLPAACTLLGAGVDRLLGGSGPVWEGPTTPRGLLVQAATLLVFGPIPEELAWRGYAQGRLQERFSPLVACGIMGVLWLVWHLPLSAVEGAYQHYLGLGPRFWLFLADKLPLTLLLGWVWLRCERSTLAAILLHWAANLTGELLALSVRAEMFMVAGYWLLAAVVVWRGGARLRWPSRTASASQRQRLVWR